MRLEVSDQIPTNDGRYQPFALSSSSTPGKQAAVQQYKDLQRGLAMLHRMTAILPPDKVLDGTVRKLDDYAVVGGSASDIWRGIWLEEEKVALKGLRNVKVDDLRAQKVHLIDSEPLSFGVLNPLFFGYNSVLSERLKCGRN